MKISSRNNPIVRAACLTLLLGALPSLAYAHPGGSGGLAHGLVHPFSGLDHLCAMVAVGLWAAQMGGRAAWLVPLSFVAVMALGGLLGMAEIAVPFVETGIIMSLLALGLLIAAAVRLPLALSAAIVGMFALFHGYAHGAEMSPCTSALAYALGFMAASALLHLSGFTFGMLARAQLLRFVGAAVAMAGGYLWFAA
ncbi:protein hupE [Ferrigenium kumadai]|uniref:Protein hupE n=1 Tax=Ferrigenium kumadai TaxID=1682490 RepID=A0AAN1W0Y5_9PROT|nr:HupE/UreJ family protein [Ferrigenium kumadai]BBI99962.1 protein hupE [Ferrigenium kumadai]